MSRSRMGHAGAVLSGKVTAEAKFEAMRTSGIRLAGSRAALGADMLRVLRDYTNRRHAKACPMFREKKPCL
jgi:succinyl-CoA synthetase alpha subunit